MSRGPARRGGFTLIEVMVGAVVMLIILAGAVMALLAASQQHRRGLEKANLERACNLLVGQMEAELRQVGLGVPKGTNKILGGTRFSATILQADPTDIAFLADLARPDSSFNGISQLSDNPPVPLNAVAVLNELSGACDVDSNGHCSTSQTSPLFGAPPDCATNPANALSCPWALKKYRPSEWIIAANGSGDFAELQVDPALTLSSGTRTFLKLAIPRPGALFPANLPNRGFVSTPDRVFYELNAGTVRRKQCWGQIGAALDPASIATRPCNPPVDGTPWEVRARDVSALTFEYRDAADAVIPAPVPLADLRRIRRVVINLSLQRAVGTATVRADAAASATVRL